MPSWSEALDEVVRHLESAWPLEGCGVLLRVGPRGPWRCRPLRNALDARAARTAYAFEPREWLGVLQEADTQGEQVACVFHSHVEGGPGFSAEDRRQAAPGGQPLLPGVSYLVMAIPSGRVRAAELVQWDGHDFRGHPLPGRFFSRQPAEIP
ncbi:Mov34/MPN/PAD-1 family protein [Melittangium boletus]|uniref:JAB domain-containing protein n=1 Tax=Melittangium boletus DSM 14713 TaxID=1294270 RepID=A0A250IPR8_9BACT|nr:Mov34/MPN/PAD-1 family protein [Melittangium boletus]ATB32936.1 hypothetical protein MEBOL_006425 [Melittangium boletus DSM 14713]